MARKKRHVITLDFETEPIRNRPNYPPKPVSFSLKLPQWKKPQFFAWGHKTGGNNCTEAEALSELKSAYAMSREERLPILGQNLKFDLDVAEVHGGVWLPNWDEFEDTMFLLFLDDPHQRELGLKPSAARLLGMPPDEQDAVKNWVLEHRKELEHDFSEIIELHGGIKPSTAGAFVAYVPGNIAGPYANGDVLRTEKLYDHLYDSVCIERGMREAYEREKKLLPILLRNEREGLRVDRKALERDQGIYEAAQVKVDMWLRKALKAPGLDFNKDAEVAKALKAVDAVTEWTKTATGKDSVSKKNLKLSHFRNKKVAAAYSYRQKCATMLETFIRPWQTYAHGDRISTHWNQVRQEGSGARTGRPSTNSPNFLNMPRNIKRDAEEENAIQGFMMPTHIEGLPDMPSVRGYILADAKGHLVGRRDFNQQELRVLGHFEDGLLMQAYSENPTLDVHQFVRELTTALMHKDPGRYFTKRTVFGYIYGQSVGGLAEDLDKPVDEVKAVRNAQMTVIPGLKELSDNLKTYARQGLPITTWGGRQYYVETPRVIDGKLRTFEYKLINYLIQGSSADLTKEAIIRYDEAKQHGRMMLSVYDEIDIDAPKDKLKKEMLLLRDVMLSLELDVPLLSDGEIGPTLGNLKDIVGEPAYNLERWR